MKRRIAAILIVVLGMGILGVGPAMGYATPEPTVTVTPEPSETPEPSVTPTPKSTDYTPPGPTATPTPTPPPEGLPPTGDEPWIGTPIIGATAIMLGVMAVMASIAMRKRRS